MGLRHDLSPQSLTTQLTHEAMWAALEQIQPIDDPFSLLGVADIATSRAHENSKFAELAGQTIRRLSEPHLRRSDELDIYAFFPAFVGFIYRELRLIPGFGSRPAYWRRICGGFRQPCLYARFAQLASIRIS